MRIEWICYSCTMRTHSREKEVVVDPPRREVREQDAAVKMALKACEYQRLLALSAVAALQMAHNETKNGNN